MPPTRHQLIAAAVFLAIVAGARARVHALLQWRYPAMTGLVATEHYAQDVGTLLVGAHRVAANMSYMQWLQYYGLRQDEVEEHAHEGESAEEHAAHRELEGGVYPRLFEL